MSPTRQVQHPDYYEVQEPQVGVFSHEGDAGQLSMVQMPDPRQDRAANWFQRILGPGFDHRASMAESLADTSVPIETLHGQSLRTTVQDLRSRHAQVSMNMASGDVSMAVNPELLDDLSPEKQRFVLAHEMGHVHQFRRAQQTRSALAHRSRMSLEAEADFFGQHHSGLDPAEHSYPKLEGDRVEHIHKRGEDDPDYWPAMKRNDLASVGRDYDQYYRTLGGRPGQVLGPQWTQPTFPGMG